jgi:amino acid adenylation domain-containing protein
VRRFERIAAERPDSIALTFAGTELTYAQLDSRADRLARELRSRGVERETVVAVCVAPSHDIVIAMLGIWKAGGTYLPLDPSHPRARLAAIAEETRPLLLLTQRELDEEPLIPGLARCLLGGDGWSDEALRADPPDVELAPEQVAYILYTSGTTGRPKGVAASHANLAFYAAVARDRYGFGAGDTFCSIARYTFSISMFELVSPLLCGARLALLPRADVLDPARLAESLRDVTVVHAGPSLLRHLARYLRTTPGGHRSFPGVRHASCGGDMVPPGTIQELRATFPSAELFVIYGCTEISCMGCTYPVSRGKAAHGEAPRGALVGRPFPGVEVLLTDDARNIVAAGAVGEVCVAGPGVTPGYVGRPEQGAERFVMLRGARYYATGDLARQDASGNLELLGRKDDQIQLHGIRIEPTEIEHALLQAPGVDEAVVAACTRDDNEKTLVAFVVGARLDGAAPELRAFLMARLPDYMVPTEFVVLDRLPLNHNLKVDRRALPGLAEARRAATPGHAALATGNTLGVEARVAAVLTRFLGLAGVGEDDDFFALGGSSLLALRVTDELSEMFHIPFPLHTLFQCPTVRTIARLVRAGAPPAPRPVLLNGNTSGPPLFLLAAVHSYRELARVLEQDFSVHGLSIDREPCTEGGSPAPVDLAELAAEYADLLRSVQPEGPFRLGGFSFGGVVAFEVAQQLRRRGREIAHLWLIDSVLPFQRGNWLRVLGRFGGLTLGQKRQAIAREVRLARQRWRDGREPGSRAQPPLDDRVQAMDDLRTQRYLDAVKDHLDCIRPYDGPVTLMVARRRLAENLLWDPLCGWGLHLRDLRVQRVDAGHHDMLTGNAVSEVAAAFRSAR